MRPLRLALALILCGLGASLLAGLPWSAAVTHLEARHWPSVPATIDTVGLEEIAAIDGGRRLSLVVGYSYEVGGIAYRGSRASLFDAGDIGDHRLKALYTRLTFARVTGRTVPAFHRPGDPHAVLLDRGLHWWPIAAAVMSGIVLMGAGLGGMAAAFRRERPV